MTSRSRTRPAAGWFAVDCRRRWLVSPVLHELIGQHASDGVEGEDVDDVDDPGQIVVGIETDRGPWVAALLAAGYQVYAINPMS